MDEAARCDRLLLMREGRLLADDTLAGAARRHRRRPTRSRPSSSSSTAPRDARRPRRPRPEGGAGMSLTLTLATAGRVLRQMRHDPRTIALLVVVPCVLLGLLAWIYTDTPVFDSIGAPLLGIFPFVVMFLVTSIATLRERRTGTLERLLTLPLGKGDLLGGYAARVRRARGACRRWSPPASSVWVLRARRRRRRLAAARSSPSSTRCSGTALGLFLSRVRRDRVPGRAVPAGVRAAAVPAVRLLVPRDQLPAVLHGDLRRAAAVVRGRRDADHHDRRERRGDVLADLAIVLAFAVAALAAGSRHAAPPRPPDAGPAVLDVQRPGGVATSRLVRVSNLAGRPRRESRASARGAPTVAPADAGSTRPSRSWSRARCRSAGCAPCSCAAPCRTGTSARSAPGASSTTSAPRAGGTAACACRRTRTSGCRP